ncbi:hypothetical protein DAPPUDRAFT_236443 [Daphnia pulex]|uniref:Uncharacterized protein n=1 Tax=Daphnia pulex TaxID=6669 RepID=E9G108_DAPPU|nr:hypothetical protein DAPPUDRAFT_236443 [Daphnia pulex]|eukprot:EFX86583.1 hypothetical protein DAPPUDRAFT_236443 [Daphnia pulex]
MEDLSIHRRNELMTQMSIGIKPIPIPSIVNLQKERPVPVCMFIPLEGHGDKSHLDHYVKRVMQWCRGWDKEKAKEISRVSISDMQELCYTKAPKYYTTKAPDYYTTTYAALSYYTEALKYYSSPSYSTRGFEYYTDAPKYHTTKALEYCTTTHGAKDQYYTTTYVAPRYYTKAPECYIEATNYYTTKASDYYTATYAAQLITPRLPNTTPPRHRSATPLHIMGKYSLTTLRLECYTTKAPKYYTTAHVSPSYYTECPKPQVLRLRTTNEDAPANYNNAPMYYSVPSYYTEDLTCYTTEILKYCTTTYVSPANTTKAAEYYTTKVAEYYTTKTTLLRSTTRFRAK